MERQIISSSSGHEQLMNIEQIKQSFDSFIKNIDENKDLLSDENFFKEIIEFTINLNEKSICDPTIINHRIFIIFRDYFLNVLQRWRFGEKLDEKTCFIFETISNLFLKMSSYISSNNVSLLKELIFNETLLHELNRFLEDLSSNTKYLEDPQIKSIDNFFRTTQRLERTSFDSKKNDYLFDNIIKCICSSTFIQIFLQSINRENESSGEKFLLNTCTDYIYSHSIDKQHKQCLIDIRQTLLRPFTQWLNEQSSFFRLWNNKVLIIFRQISFLLTLSIQFNQDMILDKEILNNFSQLIDSFINILYSLSQSDNNKLSQSLIGTLIPNLYTMTLSNQLEKYLQNKHITSLILKLIHIDNDDIQLNVFKILSSITTEQDTKNNHYSNDIVNIFIKILKKIIDDSNQTLTFYNLLRCLKSIDFTSIIFNYFFLFQLDLVQYDQIKDEFIRENGLSLIVRCATDNKFKPLQVQQPALEILLALTFNKEAYQQLKQNSHQIKSLLSLSHQGISNTVDYILWKLENEEQILAKPINHQRNFKYDIFLSFLHSDKDLCLRISDQLVKDDFRVYIDQDENKIITMNEKCEIIDLCEYFLICASDSYKQNFYCRCEATYASERQYQIIPLIVTSNYRPDGWLNPLITGKISIDFVKQDFQLAHMKLKTEIERQKKYLKIIPKKDFISNELPIKR